MRRGDWELLWFRDFSGGLVSRPAPHQLKQGSWAELSNVRLEEDGSFKKRGGSTKLNSEKLLQFE